MNKEFSIDNSYIENLLASSKSATDTEIAAILDRAERLEGLTPEDVAALLTAENPEHWQRIFFIAGKIKEKIYGERIVMFAPLYVSDYCVNRCEYCGFNCSNEFCRRRLTMDEIRQEVEILEKMGHKRLAIEAGEDPVNCPIEYILECIDTIYKMKFKNGEIRRANVNIAATTVENYKKLKEVGIGTYILFQETYHKKTYELMHPAGPKSNYAYHTTAFDRAMQAGIDDVGGGVLFGLHDYRYEVLGLMLHNEHLDKRFGAGFHTISVPRLCAAEGVDMEKYPHLVDDDSFKKIVAIIRIAVPFTGMIISTRESAPMRREVIRLGISQISGGSTVEVGGYQMREKKSAQFSVADDRSARDIIFWLMDEDMIPSFCTACYREGRTGDRFMQFAKTAQIANICQANSIMTLCEYLNDYADIDTQSIGNKVIKTEVETIPDKRVKELAIINLESINEGKRDFRF